MKKLSLVVGLMLIFTIIIVTGYSWSVFHYDLENYSSLNAVLRENSTSKSATLNVQVTLSETSGISRIGEPVTSGIPIPQNLQLKDLSTLRLVDNSSQPVPTQFTPLARWGSSSDDSSAPIKWLLLDFQADLSANNNINYYLKNTGGTLPTYPQMSVVDGINTITVNTGVATFSLSKNDGQLTAPHLSGTVHGRLKSDGTTYTTIGSVTVEIMLNGAMRTSVKVQGSYRDAGNIKLLDYTSYYWFYAGQPYVRLFHTIENSNPSPLYEYEQIDCFDIGSEGSVNLTDLSMIIPTDFSTSLTYEVSGENSPLSGSLTNDLLLYQDSSGTENWDCYSTFEDWYGNPLDTRPRMQSYVSFRGFRVTVSGTQIGSGNHAQGWAHMSAGSNDWCVAVRDFWQNTPKALRLLTSGEIEVGLFPDEFGPAGYNFNLRCGEHKTHEILLYPDGSSSIYKSFNNPLFAKASSEWYVNSGALGLTSQRNLTDWSEHELYIDYQLTTSPDYEEWMDWYPNLLVAIEETDFYGIYDYGDVPIDYEGYGVAPMNPKYHMDFGMWVQWTRGGDLRWFKLAEAADRHIADIDILHTLHTPRHWSDGIMFGHSYHDEAGFTNPHRNEGGTSPDTAFGLPGLLLAYYFTGYEKAFDAALELADCFEYRLHNDYHLTSYFPDSTGEGWCLGDTDGLYADGGRPAANCLQNIVEAYRATADSRYLAVADALVDWAKASNQPYINGPTGESGWDKYLKPQFLNMYLLALGNYLEMRSEFSLPDTYNATGSLE
ncbi:MAG: hypothetical protein ACFFBD_11320, partial [Candidatus Hodarchaeota archaeon]